MSPLLDLDPTVRATEIAVGFLDMFSAAPLAWWAWHNVYAPATLTFDRIRGGYEQGYIHEATMLIDVVVAGEVFS